MEAIDVVDVVIREVRVLQSGCKRGALGVVWSDNAIVLPPLVVFARDVDNCVHFFYVLQSYL